jgi:hypothetical protein
MKILAWLFTVAAFVAFLQAVLLKAFSINFLPFFASDAYPFYPRSFMSFAEVALLFAITLLLLRIRKHPRD